MLKKLFGLNLMLLATQTLAVNEVNLHHAPLSSLKQFHLEKTSRAARTNTPAADSLHEIRHSKEKTKSLTRYQQFYQGIPVIGAQVIVAQQQQDTQVNGRIINEIELTTQPTLNAKEALEIAQTSWHHFNPFSKVSAKTQQLQIRLLANKTLKLVYLVSFKSQQDNKKPDWPFFIIDAHTGELSQQWNNIKNFADIGVGGNEKIQKYWYGQEGLPPLEVSQANNMCIMETSKIKVVNLNFAWDWDDTLLSPVHYVCQQNEEDPINGAYSPINDAYYFGNVVLDMYQEWYGVPALQDKQGMPIQLIMRPHFGQSYENAFWDGQAVSFGDGASSLYPLISLDIAGHEITHGFTEQHADLEYHGQSGALNESLSDMAGQAARAYLLETQPLLYNKIYLKPNEVTWGIGETITRESQGDALRFMDQPSLDGSSADCLDRSLAQAHGAKCLINYMDVIHFAYSYDLSPQQRQSYIVHTASGVFNKAFYLISQQLGIRKAYELMIIANSKYWTPTTNFVQASCGILDAARDLALDENPLKEAFAQVGIATERCTH